MRISPIALGRKKAKSKTTTKDTKGSRRMLQQKSFVYLRALCGSSFCCSLCLCGEEVFSIEQLSDENYRSSPPTQLTTISYPQWAGDWKLATVPKKWPGHQPGPLGESVPERRATELLKPAEPSARLLPRCPPPLRWFPEERCGCSSCCIRLPPAATRATIRRNPVPIV